MPASDRDSVKQSAAKPAANRSDAATLPAHLTKTKTNATNGRDAVRPIK